MQALICLLFTLGDDTRVLIVKLAQLFMTHKEVYVVILSLLFGLLLVVALRSQREKDDRNE